MASFAPGGSRQQTTTADVGLKTNPAIYNLDLVTAGIEYSQALPAGTKSFMIRIRTGTQVELRYTSGTTEYLTLLPGVVYKEERLSGTGTVTLYITSTKDSMVAEIVAWT